MLNHAGRQRGYVTVLVIIAVAIVTGLSFAMLQSSKTMIAVERNMTQRGSAKTAAQLGIEHALKQMELATWAGPASNYSKALDTSTGFEVQYAYETDLLESDPDYWQMPYRVNVRVTGYSILNGRTTRYAISAATMLSDVRLNPSKDGFAVSPPPRTVTTVDRSFLSGLFPPNLGFWNRINGTTHSVKGFNVWDNTVESSYRVSFLNEMKTAPWSAVAPLNGRGDVENVSLISSFADAVSILALDLFQVPAIANNGKYTPAGETYQIYRGGPIYTIPTFMGTSDNVELIPTSTNPWGIYRGISSAVIGKNSNISGTISMNSILALTLSNENVVANRLLRRLPDATEFEMPLLMGQLINIKADKDITATGTIIANTSFISSPQKVDSCCQIWGRVYTDYFSLATFDIGKNTTAKKNPTDLEDFVDKCGFADVPLCTINDLAPTNLHWQDTSLPFLVPKTFATDGYQWSVLSITELGFE